MTWPQTIASIPGIVRDHKKEVDYHDAQPEPCFAAPCALAEEQHKAREREQQERGEQEQPTIGAKCRLPECIQMGRRYPQESLRLPDPECLWACQVGVALVERTTKAERVVEGHERQRGQHAHAKQEHRAETTRVGEYIDRQAANYQCGRILGNDGIACEKPGGEIVALSERALLDTK